MQNPFASPSPINIGGIGGIGPIGGIGAPLSINGTLISPYNGHSENFIELLFRQALSNGWGSISLLTLIHCYAYMSLGKIKELFEYFNIKISQHGKVLIETASEKIKDLSIKAFNLASEYVGNTLYAWFCISYDNVSHYLTTNARKERLRKEKEEKERLGKLEEENRLLDLERLEQERQNSDQKPLKENAFIYQINIENMTDMMAISNCILGLRDRILINNTAFRRDSNRDKATENFVVPNVVEWQIKTNEGANVQIRLQQDIGLKLNCETDTQYEVLKNCTTAGKSTKVPISHASFNDLFEEWYASFEDLTLLRTSDPGWIVVVPSTGIPHYTSPFTIISEGRLGRLFALLFLLNNRTAITRLFMFLSGKDQPFYFRGVCYTCTDPLNLVNILWPKDGDKVHWFKEYDKFQPTFVKYVNSRLNDNNKELNKKVLPTLSTLFDPTEAIGFTLSFVDKTNVLSIHNLSIIGRNWIAKQIHDYYNQQNQRVDNRISIYKLTIKYRVEKVDVTNPKYIEWLEKNNITEEQHQEKIRSEKEEKEKKEKAEAEEKEKKEQERLKKLQEDANKTDKEKDLEKALTELKQVSEKDKQRALERVLEKEKAEREKDMEKEREREREKEREKAEREKDNENRGYEGSQLYEGADDYEGFHHNSNRKGRKKNKNGGGGWHNNWMNNDSWNNYAHDYEGSTTKVLVDNTPPSKTIKEDKYIPEVISTLVKSDKKPLEYLYLPEEVNDKLITYLKTFKESRSQYEKYGFPYRGGILLSGVPGCGKSTTILATATYLDKDIFYLDLGLIKTNTELKLCMDFIKGSSKNGGIVIFEDIDCMSDIVLQRFTADGKELITASTSLTQSIKTDVKANDKADALSLSFLLNVLDGTMAPENVIFIMTTNFPDKLDKALTRPGRIDIGIQLKKCSRYQIAKVFKDLYERPMQTEFLQRFPEDMFTTAEVILHLFYNKFNKNILEEDLLKPFLTPKQELRTLMSNVNMEFPEVTTNVAKETIPITDSPHINIIPSYPES